jgi:hypothetical protein
VESLRQVGIGRRDMIRHNHLLFLATLSRWLVPAHPRIVVDILDYNDAWML